MSLDSPGLNLLTLLSIKGTLSQMDHFRVAKKATTTLSLCNELSRHMMNMASLSKLPNEMLALERTDLSRSSSARFGNVNRFN